MKEQRVVRTNIINAGACELQDFLNDGYTVVCSTKMSGDTIEYIVEKKTAEQAGPTDWKVFDFYTPSLKVCGTNGIVSSINKGGDCKSKLSINDGVIEIEGKEINISQGTKGKELVYDQEEAVKFIQKALKGMNKQYINRGFLIAVLDAEEDYMRSKGIITEE